MLADQERDYVRRFFVCCRRGVPDLSRRKTEKQAQLLRLLLALLVLAQDDDVEVGMFLH